MKPPTMQHLFTPEGLAALQATLRLQPLLAFDFDGTLAPIVSRPADARVSQAVSLRLRALATQLPLAVVSGRAAADVRRRLGFVPRFVVGNHGAEGLGEEIAEKPAPHPALAGLRLRLQRRSLALELAGVTPEDKGISIALHYRLARDREQALVAIRDLLSPAEPAWRVFGGKLVVNVAPADAPDKAAAVHALVARCNAGTALFAGDDVNDEPVFASAPPHWLTLRIGREAPPSCARWCLDSPAEMALLLDRMLALLPGLNRE
jgi:trehalose 6-phosphate phosphatase